LAEPEPTLWRERSVSVHPSLLLVRVLPLNSSTLTQEAHSRTDVNNVPGYNN